MAADDTKGRKRKGAPDSAPKAKKPRKSEETATSKPIKASKATPAVAVPTESKSAKAKAARKQAADFFDTEEATSEPAKQAKGKKGKAAAKTNGEAPVEAAEDAAVDVQEKPKKQGKKGKVVATEDVPVIDAPKEKATKAKKGKKANATPAEFDEAPVQETAVKAKSKKVKGSKQDEPMQDAIEASIDADEIEEDADVDDQTAALLAGFESEGDSDDPSEDLNFDDDVAVPALTKKQRLAVEKAEKAAKSNEPGVIYVGRVPRGFFEAQMKQYFSQFGRVNRLRLSRNKKTGASKHFAFVEFASTEVADIVARTMDNYLLFGHILKCKLIPSDEVHADLFKGAGQRFKVDPRNKKAGLAMERGAERAQWEKRVVTENKRRTGRNKQLKEDFGYQYTGPELKAVEDVPKRVSTLENKEHQQVLEEAPAEKAPVPEPIKAKKGKKEAKTKAVEEISGEAETALEPVEPVADKKSKKDKKRKSDVALEATTVTEETAPPQTTPKSKKAKKEDKSVTIVEEVTEVKSKAKPAQEAAAKPKKARKAKA